MRTFKIFLSSLFCVIGLSAQVADSIFFNGDIVTVDDKQPTAEAVAVFNGRILFVGDKAGAMKMQGAGTTMVDLEGKTLMPGFVDPHTYLVAQGMFREGETLNVGPLADKTTDDVVRVLKDAVQKGPVLATGFDPSLMDNPGTLDGKTLDAISATVPIIVVNTSGRLAYGNSAAFQKAEMKGNGEVYGLPAIFTLISKNFNFDYSAIVKKSAAEYAKKGFTTVTDMALGLPMPTSADHISLLRNVANLADAPVRIQGYLVFPLLNQIGTLSKGDNSQFQIRGVVIRADGSVQGQTAGLSAPYKGEGSWGKLNYTEEELERRVLEARKNQIQVAIDANGDQAVADAVKAFENAQHDRFAKDPRYRVEHATVASEDLLQKMHDTKATPSFSNLDLYYWGEKFRDTLGRQRAKEVDLAATAKRVGMKFSFNDNAPLAGINPLLLIQVGVTRETANGQVLNPEERVTVDDAIKAVTLWPAWQSFREKELGSIEVGKLADFVLLDQNPKKVDPTKIGSIKVLNTYLGGRKI